MTVCQSAMTHSHDRSQTNCRHKNATAVRTAINTSEGTTSSTHCCCCCFLQSFTLLEWQDQQTGRNLCYLYPKVLSLKQMGKKTKGRRRSLLIFGSWRLDWYNKKQIITRMWANAQPDGRPAEHRWRPLFNAAKFGWRPLLDAVQ